MVSLRPLTYSIGKLIGLGSSNIADAASDQWEIDPAETLPVPPVIILPGQAERIRQAEFTTMPLLMQSLAGNPAERISPTKGFRIPDVDIVDGVVYARGVTLHLRQRRYKTLLGSIKDLGKASFYETWIGNRWFGNWLTDDCLTYRLAETSGSSPATTTPERGGHVPRYEELLGMAPRRVTDAHFDELVLFDDHANNSGRMRRAQQMRDDLLTQIAAEDRSGVFLLRGRTGDLRILENEMELATRLERDFGFRIMQAEKHSVDELIAACANARIVAGVEGSQLNHGIVAMPPGGTLLTIQPPDRATTAMKLLTDRWQQRFAMLIGEGETRLFRVDPDELSRTVELIYHAATK
ncbi:glycosyltransferase 61 family protein [Paracoccus aestuariivivens]|uniref:DUF563 domain-containing protein n=1 Tax=Paracoccus aestuariivivens TaxID=1820333 RepID=A0A6L6JI55_9RHOB|nr:glycosyltransferase family 61 protein [Paracoccus aestuariivivens]MTH79814.1 DUF563 domain-containing protein [Paracoccus aestuariivivens]